jgi:hypothetical protein
MIYNLEHQIKTKFVCAGEDSNLQAFRHHHLKVASLPISPPAQVYIFLPIIFNALFILSRFRKRQTMSLS